MEEAKQRELSIYEYMAEQMQGDTLPEHFELPSDLPEGDGPAWADGAMDGVYLYHMPHTPLTAEETGEMSRALMLTSEYRTGEADAAFLAFTKEHRVISFADELLMYIMEHEQEINASNLYRYGIGLMIGFRNREMVKLGLTLMEMFDTAGTELGDVIRSLGLSDEFTLFSILNMQRWPNGNEEIFDLIRHVHGWGRIHALERLEPDNDAIRDWILANGVRNDVMDSYSALTAFEKSGAGERLKRGAGPEELKNIGRIFSALLNEGPVTGISALEDAAGWIRLYLDQISPAGLSAEELEQVRQLYYYCAARAQASTEETKEQEAWKEASERAVVLLRSPETEETVKRELKEGRAVELAVSLGIPFRKELLSLMTEDFDKYYGFCAYLMDSPAYAEAVLDLYRKHIPLEDLSEDAGDLNYVRLAALLEAMQGDCRTAGDILMKMLEAPALHCRYLTLQCLEDWTDRAQQPLKLLSERLWEKLKEVHMNEGNPELKDAMQKLMEKSAGSEA